VHQPGNFPAMRGGCTRSCSARGQAEAVFPSEEQCPRWFQAFGYALEVVLRATDIPRQLPPVRGLWRVVSAHVIELGHAACGSSRCRIAVLRPMLRVEDVIAGLGSEKSAGLGRECKGR
jgi:hypothetical protein